MSDLAQVCFALPPDTVEAVSNLLAETVAAGIEQRDGDTMVSPSTATAALTELVVWMPTSDIEPVVARVKRLLDSLGEMGSQTGQWSWRSEQVDATEWLEAYRRFFKVVRLGRRIVIKPSWESYSPAENDIVIEIDPGQAFGTGLHASTRLAVRALERCARVGADPVRVLDLGCGTGILAMVAAHLWPNAAVIAVDNDPVAVTTATDNIARNNLESRISVRQASAAEIDGQFGLIAANLTSELLSELQSVLRPALDESAWLIMSGILNEQAHALNHAYTHDLMLEAEYTEEDAGWWGLVVRSRGT